MKKLLFISALLLTSLMGLELVSWMYSAIFFKEDLKSLYQHATVGFNQRECSWGDLVSPHPYLFVRYHQTGVCKNGMATSRGMLGEELPWRLNKEQTNLLVLGGSVAEGLYVSGELEKALNKSPLAKAKPFKVWNAAITAGQQPRQAFAHLLYGDGFDYVISLEGFNEHFNLKAGFPIEAPPHSWYGFDYYVQTARNQEVSFRQFLAQWANLKLRTISDGFLIKHSHLAYFFLTSLAKSPTTTTESRLYPPTEMGREDFEPFYFAQYDRLITSMIQTSQTRRQKFFVFIQPVPAIAKPLTAKDKANVGDLSYADYYRRMSDHLLVKFPKNTVALLDVFSEYKEDLYVDLIHFLSESKGNQILAEKIVEALQKKNGTI